MIELNNKGVLEKNLNNADVQTVVQYSRINVFVKFYSEKNYNFVFEAEFRCDTC
jgi:hypothetical protein